MALTDSPQSPLVRHADVCLFAQAENPYAANSDSAVLALIEALSSAVAYHARDAVQSAARVTEAVLPWLVDGDPQRLRHRPSATPGAGQASPPPLAPRPQTKTSR